MAVGSDFTAVGNSADREKALQDAQMQAALGHLLGTLGAMREQRNIEAARGMQQQQFAAALAQRQYENEIQRQQMEVANKRLDVQQKISQGYLDLGQKQLDLQKNGGTPQQIRDREFITQRAAADADQGMFDSPDDILKKYPVVDPAMAQALYAHSVDARQRMTDAYNFGANAAATLNRLNDVNGELKDLDSKHSIIGGWFNSNDAERGKALRDEQAKLNSAKALLQSNKNFSSLVSFDPQSGSYINAASPPTWGKGTPAAAVTPYTPSASPADNGTGFLGFNPGPAPTSSIGPWGISQPDTTLSPEQQADLLHQLLPATRPTAPAPVAGASMPQPFYDRVNALIGTGLDPQSAKRQALAESLTNAPTQ